ncbi:hypothetical protein GAGA_1950 [Paraglaciecola agarilytica NO2]|uniref:Uncharacterized protein n=1 Tax=Paraglaciecola agarilytica NO2 TaxID=1125747 RepID=A0ABQ0I624_9ALTE|nr:hypothetical protein GAGA_1950 [Paraglaciecola agarilytica NO2]
MLHSYFLRIASCFIASKYKGYQSLKALHEPVLAIKHKT